MDQSRRPDPRRSSAAQAQKDALAVGERPLALTPEEQLAFWTALNAPVVLTDAQRRLGAIMRGEA